jgi:hypothetical protein
VIGAPKGYDFSISDGLISQIRSVDGFLQYQVSCPISPGNSGSPIFNNRGEVIGIASWTKVDAQNVNFAIPTREFTRLDVSERLTTWEELSAIILSEKPVRLSQSRHTMRKPSEEEAAPGDFAAFKNRINGCAGKPLTVIIQEEGRTNYFTFTVPPAALE